MTAAGGSSREEIEDIFTFETVYSQGTDDRC
jgi:hypothetical protein